MLIFSFSLALILLLFLPDRAFAWAPTTHLEVGRAVLQNLFLLAPAIKELIETFPHDYLYGNISADIVIGKKYAGKLKNCHNWNVGFKIFDRASTPSQKAFALGYLSHLAADTIAHNYYIPERMILSFSTRTLRHTYWELRFGSLVDKEIWQLPKMIAKDVHRDNDRLLKAVFENKNLFSFKTNKTIFSSILLIKRMNSWHKMMDRLSSRSKWILKQEEKDHYFRLSYKAVVDLLTLWGEAPCLKEDPTGYEKLKKAKHWRKKLKRLYVRNVDVNGLLNLALKEASYQSHHSDQAIEVPFLNLSPLTAR
jgi:hypothetical protein